MRECNKNNPTIGDMQLTEEEKVFKQFHLHAQERIKNINIYDIDDIVDTMNELIRAKKSTDLALFSVTDACIEGIKKSYLPVFKHTICVYIPNGMDLSNSTRLVDFLQYLVKEKEAINEALSSGQPDNFHCAREHMIALAEKSIYESLYMILVHKEYKSFKRIRSHLLELSAEITADDQKLQ